MRDNYTRIYSYKNKQQKNKSRQKIKKIGWLFKAKPDIGRQDKDSWWQLTGEFDFASKNDAWRSF